MARDDNEDMSPALLPFGYHSVNPYIVVRDASAFITFLIEAFDGKDQSRELSPDGVIEHADVLIGDSLVMISESRRRFGQLRASILATATPRTAIWCAKRTSIAPAHSAELDDPADVLAVAHVLITLVDLIKGVFLRDQLVEFQSPVSVHHQQLGDGGAGTAGPEQ
jgi:hypothetical protein